MQLLQDFYCVSWDSELRFLRIKHFYSVSYLPSSLMTNSNFPNVILTEHRTVKKYTQPVLKFVTNQSQLIVGQNSNSLNHMFQWTARPDWENRNSRMLGNHPDSSLLALAFHIKLFSSVSVTWNIEGKDTGPVVSQDSPTCFFFF